MILDLHTGGHVSTPPKEGEVFINRGSHATTGLFEVVIRDLRDNGKLKTIPLNFLRDPVEKSYGTISLSSVPTTAIIVAKIKLNYAAERNNNITS